MSGVFAVSREIWGHPVFAPEPYTEREAWLWLVGAAVWKASRVRAGRKVVALERGQLVFSERFLVVKWRWSKTRVRRFLERLKNEAMVCLLADREATRITICNYDKYAFAGTTRRPRSGPETGPPADHSRTKEEREELNKEEEDTASGKYVFESGVIRLTDRDFNKWRDAFPNIDLKAELLSLTEWAGSQQKWFYAVSSALAKRNRDQKVKLEQAKSAGAGYVPAIPGII